MKTYKIVATTGDVAQDSFEVLGEAFGLTYVERMTAQEALDQLRDDASDHGFGDVVYDLVEVEQADDADLPRFARAVLGERHSGDVAILDADADDPTTEAGEKAAGNYAYLCPLRRWGDVAPIRDRARARALRAAASAMLSQEGIVLR